MSGVLFGTDNGYIVRRLGANNWEIVYTSSLGSHSANGCIIRHLTPTPSAPQNIICAENSSPTTMVVSTDGGATWAQITTITDSPDAGHTTGRPPLNHQANMIEKDIDGNIYGIGDLNNVDDTNDPVYNIAAIVKSSDGGFHWPGQISYFQPIRDGTIHAAGSYPSPVSGQPPEYGPAIENGYTWNVINHDNGAGTVDGVIVIRTDLDGANLTFWNFTGGSYVTLSATPYWDINSGYMSTYYGSNRIYVSSTFPDGLPAGPPFFGTPQAFASIDVSTGTPIINIYGVSASFAPGHITALYRIIPISDQVAVALIVDDSDNLGKLFRTTDAGATWTHILTSGDLIGTGTPSAGLRVSYDDPNILWAGYKVPHTFYSTDAGLNWTEEDYNGPSLGAATKWTALAVTTAAVFPGQARLGAGAVQLWQRTAF